MRRRRFASGFPAYKPKKPPPAHGIKMAKAGTTWWGRRWIEALEVVLGGDARRLARGRTYARAGRTHDLSVAAGKVTAKVTGSRASPYRITVQLAQLPAGAWEKAIAGMAGRAEFAAELLAGRMPEAIDDAFASAGTSLFPRRRADLTTSCSCPDWGDPCKHVAATHYVLGEALDRDPFLLFELRGRTREEVLVALRAARSGGAAAEPPAAIQGVMLGRLRAADYDKPPVPLPTMHFSFDEPEAQGAVLRQLGTLPGWTAETTPADVLAPVLRAAAKAARGIALDEEAGAGDEPLRRRRRR